MATFAVKCWRILMLVLAMVGGNLASAAETLVFDQPQVAGISGFRAFWDIPVVLADDGLVVETKRTPGGTGPNAVWAPTKRDGGTKPGAIVFDAVHRSVLVRFPGSAQQIANALGKGFAIVRWRRPSRSARCWRGSV